jgi:hypothetical protein
VGGTAPSAVDGDAGPIGGWNYVKYKDKGERQLGTCCGLVSHGKKFLIWLEEEE